MPQPLLHHQEHGGGVARLHQHQAIGGEPDAGQGRGEQVAPLDRPKHLTAHAGKHARNQQRRRRTMLDVRARPGHLVKRTALEPACGESVIKRSHPERDRREPRAPCAALDAPDPSS